MTVELRLVRWLLVWLGLVGFLGDLVIGSAVIG